jgi:hypothetical protein
MNKILFLLKRREDYSAILHSNLGLSTGLYNSASFMNDMLNNNENVSSKMVVVTDNNDIDREVTKYRPTHVIIEALWVVPTKFAVLSKLHPNVKWIIRLHSEMPFMAGEGMAMDWIADYLSFNNVYLGVNAPRMLEECKLYLSQVYPGRILNYRVIYLPNYYPQEYKTKTLDKTKDTIDIGCFGAIRPLKNHMLQAISAVKFADSIGKKLNFHVNTGRLEMKGEPVMRNLQCMFMQLSNSGHQLINHAWTPREEFLKICGQMDIGMQVSFSETFNIVGADLVSQGVPLIGSKEIPWISSWFTARPTETDEIYKSLQNAYRFNKLNVYLNQNSLTKYTDKSELIWIKYFGR